MTMLIYKIIKKLLHKLGLLELAIYFKINYHEPKKIYNRIHSYISDKYEILYLRLLPGAIFNTIKELENGKDKNTAKITITLCSRKLGNPDNALQSFLNSLLKRTNNIENIEVLIKIDDDDNLLYYKKIKKIYSKEINVRIFVTSRQGGYGDMHHFHSFLVKQRSQTSNLHYILTDDAEIQLNDWDQDLINRSAEKKGRPFIATAKSIEETIKFHGPNPIIPVAIYWIGGDDYPIFSFNFLVIAKDVTSKYSGWTEFGNYFCIDQYPGVLLKTASDSIREKIHLKVPLYARRMGGEVNWSESPTRSKIRNHALLNYFKPENEYVWLEILNASIDNFIQ